MRGVRHHVSRMEKNKPTLPKAIGATWACPLAKSENGGVVQGIEHRITNPVVASSKLAPATIL